VSSVSRGRTLQLLDNLTWTKGSHTLKTGVDVRRIFSYLSNGFGSTRNGVYTFNGSVTNSIIGNPYAAFLMGINTSSSVSRNASASKSSNPATIVDLFALRRLDPLSVCN